MVFVWCTSFRAHLCCAVAKSAGQKIYNHNPNPIEKESRDEGKIIDFKKGKVSLPNFFQNVNVKLINLTILRGVYSLYLPKIIISMANNNKAQKQAATRARVSRHGAKNNPRAAMDPKLAVAHGTNCCGFRG